ncbi:OLC1v1030870C1 [Oldenlandia corymbosa var. corymbosa]|uniref:OLC1v1030870C1 n=1 Tax=Oldenlandia corymbosa var. corymbosa TaxID=529605 RepID=A0AAV1CIZ8_OLDCO|nr:OLC1v1030870C1 [Oldenlandia corymbosa var. corymbosa]
MGVGDRGIDVYMAGGDRVVEMATTISDRGKAPIPPEWRNGDWIDDMLSSDRVMSYLVDDSGLINAECSGSKSIEQSYCASKSTQGHSSVVDPLQSDNHINELGDDVMLDDALRMEVISALKEYGEDNSGNELGVDNVMVEEDSLHKKILSVTKNNDLAVFTLVGKTARSEKETYDLYNDHARLIAFSVRVGKQKFRGKTDKVRMKKFYCNREGYKRSGGNGDVCHERINFRCGCPAYIHFTVDKDGLWTCTKHLVDQNHDLVPNEMIGLLRSQREVDENDMKIIRDMTMSGIPLVDAYKVYTVEAFREVQQLHKDGMLCRQEQLEVSNDGNIVTYNVWRFEIEHFKHVVVHDTRLQRFSCMCRYYSEAGMLCCHILRICHVTSVDEFPKDYICMRWTKDLVYASEYHKYAKKCCDEAVDRLKKELGSFIGSNNNDESVDNDGVIKNPVVKRKKFGPRNERPKSIVEKACNKVRGRKTNARIAADRTRASVASDLHYQSMPFPYPKGAAQDFSGLGSFAAVNASHQSMPSLNVNSGGFSFTNPSIAAQDFSGAGASTSVNASHQSMPFINENSSGFSFPIPKGAGQEFQGASTSAAVNASHQNMTFMNQNFGGFSFSN